MHSSAPRVPAVRRAVERGLARAQWPCTTHCSFRLWPNTPCTGQNDAGLWPTDALHSLKRVVGQKPGPWGWHSMSSEAEMRSRRAMNLGSSPFHHARDNTRLLGDRWPECFDEGADDVVMGLPRLVVIRMRLLHAFGHRLVGDHALACFRRAPSRQQPIRGCSAGDAHRLHCPQQGSCSSILTLNPDIRSSCSSALSTRPINDSVEATRARTFDNETGVRNHLKRRVLRVAPINVTVPASTAPNKLSCCDLENRWISSMNNSARPANMPSRLANPARP